MTDLERHDQAVNVDEETLKYLGYDPADVATRALVLLAQKYELDPLLGEIQLIKPKGGAATVYVTRDGMLAVAHRSGVLDGITVDQQRRNTSDDGWTTYVSVWRKDMGHPFTYGAQCKDSENKSNPLEMSLARAERRALKRAFQIGGDDIDAETDEPALTIANTRQEWVPTQADEAQARKVARELGDQDLAGFFKRHGIRSFRDPWPPAAVADILMGPADALAGSAGPAGDIE